MENRSDSVDALMYAYYEFMKNKEENQMLEKDKNCIEFSMHSMMATHKPYQEDTEIAITGMAPGKSLLLANNLFDIPCDVIMISKRAFDRLQADNQHYREMSKQWEEDYNLLLKKTGFDTIESLVFYLTNVGLCDTLLEAIENYISERDKTLMDMKKKLEEWEKDYISAVTKAEALDKENEGLKKKLAVPDPFAEYKELLEKLHSKEDVEKFEWTLNHICGGQASANGWMVTAKLWRRNYESLSKLVGFSSTEEIQDYLTNEAECDTLQAAVSKLKDQVKYTCDEWYSANSNNNSWKAAAECNSPKELIEKRETLEKEIEVYSRALKEWKEGTGYSSPSAFKSAFESGASWCHAYNEIKKANEKLADDVKSWKNITGYATPEDYMHARINGIVPFDYTAAWQEFTGCDCAQDAGVKINHLCDEVCELKGDYDRLLKLTGYTSEEAIHILLTFNSEKYPGRTMREYINGLKNLSKFTESAWQAATGCKTPDKARESIADMMSSKETTIYLGDTHNVIARWQKVTGYDEPKDFLKWKANIEGIVEAWKSGTGCNYPGDAKRLLEKWKTMTKSETPETAASLITAYEKACERGNQLAEREKEWQKATGCDTPGRVEEKLEYYKECVDNARYAVKCTKKHLENITF